MTQPGERARPAVDQTEIIEHIERLGADQLALAGDQIALADADRRQAVLTHQLFDAPLAEEGVTAQVGATLEAGGDQAAAEAASGHRLVLQLQIGGLQQGSVGDAGHHPLAEHAQLGLAHRPFPAHQLGCAEVLQPLPFGSGEIERVDAGLLARPLLLHLGEAAIKAILQLAAGPFIHHLHLGAGHHLAAPLLQGRTVHHGGVLGRPHGERGRQTGPQAGLHQPGPAGEQGHQQAGQHHGRQAAAAPGHDRQAGALQPQQAAPQGSDPPEAVGHGSEQERKR